MGRILKPMVRGGGWYPSNKWIPLVKNGGYTTQNGGGDEPEPPTPEVWKTITGSIVSFVTSVAYPMRSLLAQINPVQDLHGYDAPWPAGGGANKIVATVAGLKSANTSGLWSGDTYTANNVTFEVLTDDGGNITGIKANGTASGTIVFYVSNNMAGVFAQGALLRLDGITGGSSTTYKLDWQIIKQDSSSAVIVTTYSGTNNVTISEAAQNATASYIRIVVYSGAVLSNQMFYPMIKLQSDASNNFVPSSNECPISGWTGLSGERDGKNLIDWKVSSTPYSVVLKPNTYTLSWNGTFSQTGNWYLRGKDSNGDYYTTKEALSLGSSWTHSSSSHWNYSGVSNPFTFTVPSGCTLIEFLRQNSDGTIPAQLEVGSSATDFEAYQGETITCTWQTEAGTVYGGTVDVVTGVLTVTDAIVDLGTLDYNYQSTYERFYATISNMKSSTYPRSVAFLCSCFEVISDKREIDQVPYGAIYNGTGININIKIQGITDATAFKNYVTGQTLVYPLAQPQTYQLTPQQILTLLGNNTVFVDCGAVEVEYLESGTPTVVT